MKNVLNIKILTVSRSVWAVASAGSSRRARQTILSVANCISIVLSFVGAHCSSIVGSAAARLDGGTIPVF